eukprot:CAMPEP_0118681704 /NCGR_PEP_ID=MMETSP0800-20121206/5085_1 /TAXON_ID=210618 ORGANISM="Striatella unipunctata, Strain CCMP2910" /NCGR_SAMPLE_ID=MMETSP0800 /ASSEMBLY_ACC=CAM_ASM_000638 /LENGTH=256 /DNA_ID=CAMNT_0006578027 /DNA_START=40 /DNA_END=810 /DNA_ORIENTATION=-
MSSNLMLPNNTLEQGPRFQNYVVAVELNNIGVALYEHNSYESSFEVLKDAVNAMKSFVRPEDNSFACNVQQVQDDERVVLAQHRLLQVLKASNPSSVPMLLPDYSYATSDSRTLYVHDDPEAFNRPLRIDRPDMRTLEGNHDPDMESSLMLFNLALVHKTMAMAGDLKFLGGAIQLYEMAYTIMSDTVIDITDKRNQRRVILVIAILNNLIQMKHDTGREDEAREYFQYLLRISHIVKRQERLTEFIEETSAAAAA